MRFFFYKEDISASIVVFLVAVPLCLGIALASGMPPISGIISGIVGGIIVGIISNSPLGVSGPAAGLVAICISAISELGSIEKFLFSVIIAGFFQVLFGILKGGKLSYFFPNSVISGMLVAIGLIIILKQLPHAVGYDRDYEGDMAYVQPDNETTFTEIINAGRYIHVASVIIFLLSISIVLFWQMWVSKRFQKFAKIIQAPLMVVLIGILIVWFSRLNNLLLFEKDHLVNIPSISELISNYKLPRLDSIFDKKLWYFGFIFSFVASIETLLCVEATDNLDIQRRITNRNRELVAQGVGNIISGILGGLPITQVIVRSSANITFGAKTKMSTILHGLWLFLSVIFLRDWLNLIPLSSLATILIIIGYNLAHPNVFKKMYLKGWKEFIPFVITILVILFTDLLIGTLIGLLVSVFVQFYISSQNSIKVRQIDKNHWIIKINDKASFMNKSKLIDLFHSFKENDVIEIFYKGNDVDIIDLLNYQQNYLASKNIICHLNIITNHKITDYENTQH